MSSQTDGNKVACCNILECRCGRRRLPQRIIITLLLHFLLQSNFNTRVVLNVAIVEMVKSTGEHENFKPACPNYGTPNSTHKGGTFSWPGSTKALVLYAFYIGYTITQVPGGWMADKFGARYVLGGSLVTTIASTALFPYTTRKLGYLAAVALRFVLGAAHGPCIPAICSMVSTWIPSKERGLLGGIAYGGANLGIIMGNIATGAVIERFNAWSAAFYLWASYSACYFLFYLCYVHSFPATHPFISDSEMDYIHMENAHSRSTINRELHTPWKKILTNVPLWANIAAHFGHNYIYLQMITYLPTYMSEILQFGVSSGGYYAGIPFVALWITSILLSFCAPLFRRCMAQHTFDKYLGAGNNIASAALALAAVYIGCDRFWSIGLYVASMIVKAFYYVSLPVNINALSNHYGGILFGLTNAVSSISGIISNSIIGAMTKDKQLFGWKMAYWVTLSVAILTTIIYFCFSSAERQEFDYQEGEDRVQSSGHT